MSESKTIVQVQPIKDEFLSSALAVDAIVGQQRLIKDVMQKVMVKDTHYGTIAGCPKPSLWKAGAEVICMTFRLAPDFTSETVMDGKHMTVRSVCRLTHIPTGKVFGSAEAICSTKEKKYRLRKDGGRMVENNNLEDLWNTIIKMANKRALIAAVLIVTAASDILTQDMGEEVYVENEDDNAPVPAPEAVPAAATPAPGPAKEEAKQPEATHEEFPKGKLTWTGVITSVNQLDSNGHTVWELHGNDGVIFKTADGKVVKDGVEKDVKYLATYEVNGKGTKVLLKLKEVKNGK